MKKFISAALAALMLFGAAASVIADDTVAGLTLAEGSRLKLDSEKGYVDMIDGAITVGELKANFAGDFAIAGKNDEDPVATDDVIGDYKVLIYGDVDRNGKIILSDASGMLKHIAGWSVDINTDAADVDKTGSVNLSDVSKMLKYVAGWDDISLGNVRWVFENKKLSAEKDSADTDMYFESAMVKLSRSDTDHTGYSSYKINAAKNETESCQVYVTSKNDVEGMTIELSEFEHEYGEGTLEAEIFLHYYYKMYVSDNVLIESGDTITRFDYFPETLLTLADSFEVAKDTSQGFTINVTTTKDTPAGMYKAVLSVKDADGAVIESSYLYVNVWDFALPDAPYSKSAFGMSSERIYVSIGMYGGDDNKTLAEHYDFLLDHNISAYHLPYDITDPRADAYMSDPRVTSFQISSYNLSFPDQDNWSQVMRRWEKLQTNSEWMDKAYFYYVDEPYSDSGAARVKGQYEFIKDKLGTEDFDIIEPFGNNMADQVNNIDMLEFLKDYVTIFVPTTTGFLPNFEGNHYNEGWWTPRQAYNKYGESLPRLMAIKEDPEKDLWWYTCVSPQYPYPNLFTNYHGVMTRVIWWQQFLYDTEGFLYWAVQGNWNELWRHPVEYPDNGDGALMYIGQLYGRTEPLASWRLTHVRDGFDDFDILKMAEEVAGRQAVLDIVTKLTTNVTTVREDPDLMLSLRREAAELILAGSPAGK